MKKISLALLGLLLFAPPALAGNTTVFSPVSGDVVLPLSPPTNSGTTPGALDNTTIGATTPAAVSATTLSASGAVALSPASANVVLSPTGTGVVTINPATAGTTNNIVIGGVTPLAGTFTAITGTSVKFTGTAPVPTGTGTPTIATGSTDNSGEVTAGASATSVVITFATVKTNAPFCVVRSQAQIASFAYTISTSAITITQTATSGNLIDYVCVQH